MATKLTFLRYATVPRNTETEMIPHRVRQWIVGAFRKIVLRTWTTSTVQRLHSVSIADVRKTSDEFQRTIASALDLLESTDPRRYHRVTRHLDWIVNQTHSTGGAMYLHWARACVIDFEESPEGRVTTFSIARHASVLIHEATHAHLMNLGIAYDESNRERIERLCVREENRWASHLENKELRTQLYQEFDPNLWDFSWRGTHFQHFQSTLRNLISK